MKKQHGLLKALRSLVLPLILVAVVAAFSVAMLKIDADSRDEQRQQLEDTLRLSAVSCYATEGKYPPSLDYLVDRYGVQIDNDRYAVFYEIFAENIMPDITVVERNEK